MAKPYSQLTEEQKAIKRARCRAYQKRQLAKNGNNPEWRQRQRDKDKRFRDQHREDQAWLIKRRASSREYKHTEKGRVINLRSVDKWKSTHQEWVRAYHKQYNRVYYLKHKAPRKLRLDGLRSRIQPKSYHQFWTHEGQTFYGYGKHTTFIAVEPLRKERKRNRITKLSRR